MKIKIKIKKDGIRISSGHRSVFYQGYSVSSAVADFVSTDD